MNRGGLIFNRRGALRAGFLVALLGASSIATANDSVVGAASLGTAVTTTPDDTEVVSPDALTGEARTSIPIVVPPARGSVQLGLALDYDSATGTREAGVGWGLRVAAIERKTVSGPPLYQDPPAGQALDPTKEDRFAFDGEDLVPMCLVGASNCRDVQPFPAWASGGWTYFRLHHDQIFARFFWSPDHLTWRVQFKSGELMELGAPYQSGDTSALAFDGDPKSNHVYRWNVTSRLDPQSSWTLNGILYKWSKIDARSPFPYLTDIYDTPPPGVNPMKASLDSFEHHVRIAWKAWSTRTTFPVVTPIWRAVPNYEISDIDVTSKVWGDEGGARGLVRRYHLRYDGQLPIANHEFLTSLQIEGNCGPVNVPREPLPSATHCGLLPPTAFAYSDNAAPHVEALDGSVLALPSAGRSDVTMMDVDNDGIMDFVQPPPAGSTKGTLYLGRFDGTRYALRAWDAETKYALGVLARTDTHGLSLLGDWGGGQLDVQLWPDVAQHNYAVYELKPSDLARDAWEWVTVGLPAIPPVSLYFDKNSRFFDLDGDGLLDALTDRPSPSAHLSARSLTLASAPLIVPYAREVDASRDPVWSHPDGTSADMDGDGVNDLVIADAQGGGVYYYAGNGARFDGTAHAVRNATGIQPGSLSQVYFHDVTGDGLADAVVLNEIGGSSIPSAAGDLRVYVNVDGTLFADPVVFKPTQLPAWAPGVARLEFADMNGSGVDDIVFIGGTAVGFIDFMATPATGAPRPGLLTKITNGRGLTTEITYVSTVQEQALPNVHWTMKTPQATAVVSTTRVYDATTVGRGEVHLTSYNYRDPVYDSWQRKLLGFKGVTITHGDFAADATWSEDVTYFFDDRCAPTAVQSFVDTTECVDDSPFEVLHGTPVVRETSSQGVSFLSTVHYQYTLQQLGRGLDGRRIWNAYRSVTDTFLYDAGSASSGSVLLDDVFAPDWNAPKPRSVPIRHTGHVHLRTTTWMDNVGNTGTNVDMGQVDDTGAAIDAPITTSYAYVPVGDGSTWMWGVQTASVQPGSRAFSYDYDTSGNVLHVWGQLTGTVPLNRHHEAGQAVAPPPTNASSDNPKLLLATNVYNPDGSIQTRSGARSCMSFSYDQAYGRFPTRTFTSTTAGCGGNDWIGTTRSYDRGFGAVTWATEGDTPYASGPTYTTTYDEFGRVVTTNLPDPTTGLPTTTPNTTVIYDMTSIPNRVHVQTLDHDGIYRHQWIYADGFGRALVALQEADKSAGDGGGWIVRGLPDRDANGNVVRAYRPWFWDGDPNAYPVTTAAGGGQAARFAYDVFERLDSTFGPDDQIASKRIYHPLSLDVLDANDVARGGQTRKTAVYDGHGRVVESDVRTPSDLLTRYFAYQATGELTTVKQLHGSDPAVVRTMVYDSLGRMVQNLEPNATTNGVGWTYAYDDDGHLVGTSDARGCGKNVTYDRLGRPTTEDYSPCLAAQAPYTPGPEARYSWDFSALGQFTSGRLVAYQDRGARTQYDYDARGRVTATRRQLARPSEIADGDYYAQTPFEVTSAYDEMGRLTASTTGATAPELLVGGQSSLSIGYSARGIPTHVGSSYGDLVTSQIHDADGVLLKRVLGDLAQTTQTYGYDGRRRLASAVTSRPAPGLWAQPSTAAYPAPPATTTQRTLEHLAFSYDGVDNLKEIDDLRGLDGDTWPAGTLPVSRTIEYDDLYRVSKVTYSEGASADVQTPVLGAKDGAILPQAAYPTRVQWQTFRYDARGNLVLGDDDLHANFDRSVGGLSLDPQHPDRVSAGARVCPPGINCLRQGTLRTQYDAVGNLTSALVTRLGACSTAPGGRCVHRFVYDWDEVGQLVEARRWDYTSTATVPWPDLPTAPPAADLHYSYSGGQRVSTEHIEAVRRGPLLIEELLVNAEIFPSLRLNRAQWTGTDYQADATTETVYLGGLARVLYAEQDPSTQTSGRRHVFLELADHLGSTSTVIDKDTSELVERATYTAYGETESELRSDRWGQFREDYRFTGKEEDVAVGLVYFGARYYSPGIGRFISPDPLTVHGVAGDLNPYAYVSGRLMSWTDPTGLSPEQKGPPLPGGQDDGQGGGAVQVGDGGFGDWVAHTAGDVADAGWDVATSAANDLRKAWNGIFGGGGGAPPPRPPCAYCTVHGDPAGVCSPEARAGGRGWRLTSTDGSFEDGARSGWNSYLSTASALARQTTFAWDPYGVMPFGRGFDALRVSSPDRISIDAGNRTVRVNRAAAIGAIAGFLPSLFAGPEEGGDIAAVEGAETASTYVYQLVDEAGDAVYYGISNNPARRLAEHAAEGAFPFNGMQVISDAQPLAQARALESALIQQATAEGRTIYNVAPNSISPLIPAQVPSMVPPVQTLLNPKYYLRR